MDLSKYQHSYDSGRSRVVEALWFFAGLPILRCALLPSSAVRRTLLRIFGAKIGAAVVIKPGVRVKYPWLLRVGDHVWLGEDCWIDNLAMVSIGKNVCVSQGAYLCTGNHQWSDPAFALVIRPILVHDGAWIGARAVLGPGTIVGEGAVLGLGSVTTGRVPSYEVHAGNPSAFVCNRKMGRVVALADAAAASR